MGKDRSGGAQNFDDGGLKLVLQLLRNVKLEILHVSVHGLEVHTSSSPNPNG